MATAATDMGHGSDVEDPRVFHRLLVRIGASSVEKFVRK
jgi:hypothetical protein